MPEKDEIGVNPFRVTVQVLLLPVFTLGYIGAQTGSLIIQAVIAASVGIAVAVKLYWSRIIKLFTRGKGSKEVAADTASAAETETLMSIDMDTGKDTVEESLLPDTEMSQPELKSAALNPAGGEAGVEE